MTISRSNFFRASFVAGMLIGAPAMSQAVSVPSGTEMALFDVIFDETPDVARFRFVVPSIAAGGEGLQFEDVMADLDYLCADVVLPALAASDRKPETIVISLSEREIAFGETAPDVNQYFQPFRIQDNTCIWEEF